MASILILTEDSATRQRLSLVMSRVGTDVAIAGDLVRIQKLVRILAFDAVFVDSTSCRGDVVAVVTQLRHLAGARQFRAVAFGRHESNSELFDAAVPWDAPPAELLAAAFGTHGAELLASRRNLTDKPD